MHFDTRIGFFLPLVKGLFIWVKANYKYLKCTIGNYDALPPLQKDEHSTYTSIYVFCVLLYMSMHWQKGTNAQWYPLLAVYHNRTIKSILTKENRLIYKAGVTFDKQKT